jgi:O-acetyl-ADP-ribose deacetylase (regulator of RNase III)
MIVYKQGDVLQALKDGIVDAVIHQTNCQGVMGSGIARQIREDFPIAYKIYKEQESQGWLKLGRFSVAKIQREGLEDGCIINVAGQDEYSDRTKCNTNYAALASALWTLARSNQSDMVIAFPKIGAGLGGGDWRVIEAIIESAFYDQTVYVYTLQEPKKYSKRNDLA